jgi:competence protein ComEC
MNLGPIAFWREPDRWPLWLPVALGLGAGGYFALPVEPGAGLGWAALGLGLLAAMVAIAGWQRVGLALVAAVLLGFGLARLREARVATPVQDHAIVAHLTGRIVSIEPRGRGVRLVLDELRSGAFAPGQTPRRARIGLQRADGARPGDWLSLTAKLDAPPPPAEPGAADLGRALYFQSIGAVGFAYGRGRAIVVVRPPDFWQAVLQRIEDLRMRMTLRIHAVLPGSTGGVAGALITGTRGASPRKTKARCATPGWRMCWPSRACTWCWWGAASSGCCVR